MRLNADRSEAIATAIRQLYTIAGVEHPTLSQTIVPLYVLIQSYPGSLGFCEFEGLTAARAFADLGRDATGFGQEELDQPLSGFLLADASCGLIYVNRDGNNPIPRRRFTVAHELGHYLLHFQPAIEQASIGEEPPELVELFPLEEPIAEKDRPLGQVHTAAAFLPPLEEMEREADQFAAEILMPGDLVRGVADELAGRWHGPDLARRIASEMLVSEQAMHMRLRDLGITVAQPLPALSLN